jgi:GNAT superfamily N-acetyltransferase
MKMMRCPQLSLHECLAIARDVSLATDCSLEQGFLLGMPDETEYLGFLHADALWVCQQPEAIVGFVIAYPSTSVLYQGMAQRFAQMTWEARPLVATERLVYIDKVATRPSQRRQGITRALRTPLQRVCRCWVLGGYRGAAVGESWVRHIPRPLGVSENRHLPGWCLCWAHGLYEWHLLSRGLPRHALALTRIGRGVETHVASAPGWPKDASASGHGTARQ